MASYCSNCFRKLNSLTNILLPLLLLFFFVSTQERFEMLEDKVFHFFVQFANWQLDAPLVIKYTFKLAKVCLIRSTRVFLSYRLQSAFSCVIAQLFLSLLCLEFYAKFFTLISSF